MSRAVARAQSRAARSGRRYDTGPMLLRRRHDLRASGRVVDSLVVAAPAAAGAEALELSAGPGSLAGRLPAGLEITVGGVVYRLEVPALAEEIPLVALLDRPFEADAAAGEGVSLGEAALYTFPRSVHRAADEAQLSEELVGQVSFEVVVERRGAPVEPELGDRITSMGESGDLVGIKPTVSQWVLRVGRPRRAR